MLSTSSVIPLHPAPAGHGAGGAGGDATHSGKNDASPERIAELANELAGKMNRTTGEINKINDTTRLLALNAKIEAARAGTVGAAFSVVASAIEKLSERTTEAAMKLTDEAQTTTVELERISKTLATQVRGTRLADLALTNIDLIDRNLYERSCDVRWWATDNSPVEALTTGAAEALAVCSRRLGVILNSYTVYFDLVLADLDGRIVANGRPDRYRSVGMNSRNATWFRSALATESGEEFGFEGVHPSPLVGGERVLVYSCCVRRDGDAHGEPLGVLGILFKWDALAQTIVTETPIPPSERQKTRVCITDESGFVLADSAGRQLQDRLNFPDRERLFTEGQGFVLTAQAGVPCCIAHAPSPGFETYATGWHSVIIQTL